MSEKISHRQQSPESLSSEGIAIPDHPQRAPRRSIIDTFEVESPAATEFRRLLHNIRNLGSQGTGSGGGNSALGSPDRGGAARIQKAEPKVIMVTSAMVGEGKSTIACYMAVTAARLKDRRTLLIDCDLRRPNVHHLFGLDRNPGMTEVLTDTLPTRMAIRRTALDKLDIITAGKPTHKPTEIFVPSRIRQLIDEVSPEYDLIIVDSAPVLPVSDPMLLAGEMDGVILVLKAGHTQREIALRAKALLTGANANLLGVALNNMSSAMPYYFNPEYYGYQYAEK